MRYLSFFSGALGLDLGLERAGWECLGANEIDRHCLATIRANRPRLPLFEGDIRSIDPGVLRRHVGHQRLDAVVGGPPCQAFSTAGRRQGLNDDRGNVFLHFVDLATALEPKTIVIENVRGLLSAPLTHVPHSARPGVEKREEHKPGGALWLVLDKLALAGYNVSFDLYDVSRFGVPQVRERVVLIADLDRRVPHLSPTHGGPSQPPLRTLRDALTGLGEPGPWASLRPKQRIFLPMLGPGENWRDLPPEDWPESMGGALTATGGRVGFYRRLAWDEPSPTLTTSPTMPATLLAHPTALRPLSVREYARIQTFPDDWVFTGPLSEQYRQIGNAVPVEFGRVIGEHIVRPAARRPEARASRYVGTCEQTWVGLAV
ncbi:MAG: DNA cytosine methyltransferase [Armatimonadetes bacterium]|nr:DNA cytosine methyltransferase [Armatimonadota bacterium]